MAGVKWAGLIRDMHGNGRSVDDLMRMPLARFIAVFFPPTAEQVLAVQNAHRAELGLEPMKPADEWEDATNADGA
jgi:hypothetical protein